MPKISPTDNTHPRKPSALEIFTDRVSEQELLERLMAPYVQGQEIILNDYVTVFYGVGGVGKTTLCRQVRKSCQTRYPAVSIVRLNLDSPEWTQYVSFAQFLNAFVHELVKQEIPCPLTQALLLMYDQAEGSIGKSGDASGLWTAAVSVLDQTTQAIGIPGIGLVIQGAQWLRNKQKQVDTRDRLVALSLWPKDVDDQVDRIVLDKNLAQGLYEDLKTWAMKDGNIRIMIDGFERIQSRTRKRDCQMMLQTFAGYIAASENQELASRVRILVFGRDKLLWDELYDDSGWNDYWTQHLLAGLSELDAKEFLRRHMDWLIQHDNQNIADMIGNSVNRILDATNIIENGQRVIFPYYLDIAVDIVSQTRTTGSLPELGKTPVELQDRFFRYLEPNELHLLKILSLAEVFDEFMFDALVRENRITGYAQGTFFSSVVQGRSYVFESSPGLFRFHQLMGKSLHSLWMKSETEKEQARSCVRWLLKFLEELLADAVKSEGYQLRWHSEKCLNIWQRGVGIIVSQGPESKLLDWDDCNNMLKISPERLPSLLEKSVWSMGRCTSMKMRETFLVRILAGLVNEQEKENVESLPCLAALAHVRASHEGLEDSDDLYLKAIEGYTLFYGADYYVTVNLVKILTDRKKRKNRADILKNLI